MEVIANYAVEDALSEAVVRRCFRQVGILPGIALGREGFGYLRNMAPALNRSAAGMPYLMLTDLDRHECPPGLVTEWLDGKPRHPDFLLRVAVKEVEAWLLADRKNLARFLGIPEAVLPRASEALTDPKHCLLMAARRSRFRIIREDIVAEADHGPVQGPNYNGALARFVTKDWDLVLAATLCPSLNAMLVRLGECRARHGCV